MDLTALLYGLGASALFTSRAFLPAFLTAFALRYGCLLPYLKNSSIIQGMGETPTWFTSNWTILALGLLALLEVTGDKNAEARQLLSDVTGYIKTGMTGLTYLGVVSANDAGFVGEVIQHAGLLDFGPASIIAAVVFALSGMRSQVLAVFTDADEDDDLGIQSLVSWGEDVWASFGVLILFLFPVVMIALCAAVSGLLALAALIARKREEKAKSSCDECGGEFYRSALRCPKCEAPNPDPKRLNILAAPTRETVRDEREHRFDLVEKKRCPECATRFEKRTLDQECAGCGHQLMRDKKFSGDYLHRVRMRLPATLAITFLLSLLPVVGLIPGIIVYRYRLAGPFRRYLPLYQNLLTKILTQILFIVLISFQWVPGVGGFSVPAMALITYLAYSGAYRLRLPGRTASTALKA